MQHMDIMLFQVLGCLSMTLYAEWDTKLPANLDDQDFSPEMEVLPPDRYGLTSISHCLWRYHILYEQRLARHSDKFHKDFAWLTSPRVSVVEKEAYVERVSRTMGEKFVQHCELLNPLHVSIQIGIRSFILAIKRIVHQPGVANMKISNMPKRERDEFLRNTVECLEYYILGETTPSIAQFRWHNENYFQWPACMSIFLHFVALHLILIQLSMLLSKHATVLPPVKLLLSGASSTRSATFTRNLSLLRRDLTS
jgi:hypothetical protein